MMKIALCKTGFAGPVSGADETLVTYAIALHERGCDVRVVLLYRCHENDQYYVRLKNAGVSVEFIITRSTLYETLRTIRDLLASLLFIIFLIPGGERWLRQAWQSLIAFTTRRHYRSCLNFFKALRSDVLHVFTPDAGAVVMIRAGKELGIPVLYHELGTSNHRPELGRYYRRLERVLPLCTEVAALSPRLALEWSARFPFLNNVSVVPLIIERSQTFNLFSRLQGDSKLVVFGFAARFEEGKGPLIFLDALAQVNHKKRLALGRLAGTGTELRKVKARARQLALNEALEFVGHYSEPLGRGAFMNSLEVFVLPSLAEGTPNCVIEAMAHGLPIIATSVGGIPDIVNAECGILVPPGNADALADAMQLLARDPALRAAMGAAARRRYEKLFSPQAVLPVMLQTYARVTRNGHELGLPLSENGLQHPWIESEVGAAALP
jgi:glycosyltransferase involved in cell wall biosynthesis